MKNGVKTALSVGFILLVIGLALVAAAMLRGDNPLDVWNNARFDVSTISTGFGGLKGFTVCRTGTESFSPDEVQRIDVGWISGTVTLEPGASDRLTVTERCEKELPDDQKLCWKLENGTLYLRFCSAARMQMVDKDLVLNYPAGWTAKSVEVGATSGDLTLCGLQLSGDLAVTVTSGEILVKDCRCEDLDAGATSGSVDVQGCVCGKLTLGSTSGALRAENCRCDRIEAGSTSGDIRVKSEAKSITLSSTSGAIRCEAVPAGCDVSIGATSGKVYLQLRDTSDGQRITVATTSGDVYLDVPGAMDLDYDTASGDMSGRLESGGSGCPKVEIGTTSGDLILGAFD